MMRSWDSSGTPVILLQARSSTRILATPTPSDTLTPESVGSNCTHRTCRSRVGARSPACGKSFSRSHNIKRCFPWESSLGPSDRASGSLKTGLGAKNPLRGYRCDGGGYLQLPVLISQRVFALRTTFNRVIESQRTRSRHDNPRAYECVSSVMPGH